MHQLITKTEKQLILQRCKRYNKKYYITEDVTCLIVDALPVLYHFAYLNYLQKTPLKHNLTQRSSLALTLLSHSCHRPGRAEDPYHISLFFPREFIPLSHIVFTGEKETTVLRAPHL